jgi:hypothetical protein
MKTLSHLISVPLLLLTLLHPWGTKLEVNVQGFSVLVTSNIIRAQFQTRYFDSPTALFSNTVGDDDKLSHYSPLEDHPLFVESIENALLKMKEAMKPEFFDRTASTSLQQLHRNCQKIVHTAPSSIPNAGLGVFATTTIPKGTIVSWYPVHGLVIRMENLCDSDAAPVATLEEKDQIYFQNLKESDSSYIQYLPHGRPLESYAYADGHQQEEGHPSPNEVTLLVDVNPNRPDRIGWISHRINDGAIVTEGNSVHDDVLSYYQKSLQNQNCINVPFGPSPIMVTATTRDIGKGEELFTTYGANFWLKTDTDTDLLQFPSIQAEEKESANKMLQSMEDIRDDYRKESDELKAIFNEML